LRGGFKSYLPEGEEILKSPKNGIEDVTEEEKAANSVGRKACLYPSLVTRYFTLRHKTVHMKQNVNWTTLKTNDKN
jgi:hypothetical protein